MYRPGDHYVICDMCGLKKLRSQCRFNWRSQLVCSNTCWEPKHPALEFRPKTADRIAVRDARPEADDSFV